MVSPPKQHAVLCCMVNTAQFLGQIQGRVPIGHPSEQRAGNAAFLKPAIFQKSFGTKIHVNRVNSATRSLWSIVSTVSFGIIGIIDTDTFTT